MSPTNIKILVTIFGILIGIRASSTEALYQPKDACNTVQQEIEFWNSKVNRTTGGFIHLPQLAAVKEKAFALNGNISLLKEAESHLLDALQRPFKKKVPILCALASNYISQHRFCDALDIMLEADTYDHDRRMIDLLLFDVYLELGWESQAKQQLHTIGYDRNFDYLIRRAKWEDGKGNLDLAVRYLERAREMAEVSKQTAQLSWIYSNLGDFYGHQGDLESSRASFEKALELNPSDAHSFKGMAWIEFSARGNTHEAIAMLDRILLVKQSPDLVQLKAEMYKSLGEDKKSELLKTSAFKMMNNLLFGRMYQLPKAEYLSGRGQFNESLDLIRNELEERPTPEVYAVYASVLWQAQDTSMAQFVTQNHVLGHTFEPKALLNVLPIVIMLKEEQEILEELEGTRYELGPVAYKEVFSYLGT